MLELRDVRKSYTVADFTQVALDDVSIAFRDSEFVAVLGPSGSGKTTMLNIIGGLDQYDSGDLLIDGISTKQFKDRDWDTYRNNRIGFVFQSYNLIPHQTVLANVELALTLSGVGKAERTRRAVAALTEVGLQDHVKKLPSQLSGGQMQRVAIARALINDPEILLADEPTGALDSQTSVEVMNLLTEVARDRLVIMVTHNPELAEQYANRIVKLRDGVIEGDTKPFVPGTEDARAAKAARRTSMSFLTALALSFKNLMTKKGRTLMTAFAGSIGIIGIALILSLANGVNDYIRGVEEDTLSMYPLQIQTQGMDLTSMLTSSMGDEDEGEAGQSGDGGQSGATGQGPDTSDRIPEVQTVTSMFSSVGSNDLPSLKKYLDADGGGVKEYANSIEYSYDVTPQIFRTGKTDGIRQVNPDNSFAALGMGTGVTTNSMMAQFMSTSVFQKLPEDIDLVKSQYDVVAGDWPSSPDETLVVLMSDGGIPDLMLYAMGLRDSSELDKMVSDMAAGKDVQTPSTKMSVNPAELLNVEFKTVNAADYYVHDDTYNVWTDKSKDKKYVDSLVAKGKPLKVSGVVQAKDGVAVHALNWGIYYEAGLPLKMAQEAQSKPIVKAQLAKRDTDVFTGRTFAEEARNPGGGSDFDMSKLIKIDESKIQDAFTFDESKLSLDPSVLDLSGLDMSGIHIDTSGLPAMDLSSLMDQLDLSSLMSGMDMSAIVSQVDVQGILADSGITVDEAKAAQMGAELAAGFDAYCKTAGNSCTPPAEMAAAFQKYMETPEAQKIVAGAGDLVVVPPDAQQKITEQLTAQVGPALQKQFTEQLEKAGPQLAAQLQGALGGYMQQAMTAYTTQIGSQIETALTNQLGMAMNQIGGQLATNMSSAMSIDEGKFADAFSMGMSEDELSELLTAMMAGGQASYDSNLSRMGYAEPSKPSEISIYPKDFESKEKVIKVLDDYNAQQKAAGDDKKVITYTDLVGTMMSSVTTIINVVSYVLAAFVSISLVVSSIMIGVITYISVLERKKEIGILRSIGASKRDIRRVFNAETLIVGLVAGVIGIGVTVVLDAIASAAVLAKFNIANVAVLPWQAGVALVAISMFLTFIAGLIPSSAASRKDPVEALRSE